MGRSGEHAAHVSKPSLKKNTKQEGRLDTSTGKAAKYLLCSLYDDELRQHGQQVRESSRKSENQFEKRGLATR